MKLLQNGRYLDSLDTELGPAPVQVLPCHPLKGGKGGFGSMLRSIGAQIERTTNHEAMRDLSGRRQKDVNNERRLKEYIAGAAERQKEAEEKKEAKLAKLKRIATGENKSKHEFSDPGYDKVRSETEEKVHDAVEAAMKVAASSSSLDLKRKSGGEGAGVVSAAKKPKGLWLGDGLEDLEDDSDVSDSEEEEEEGGKSAVAVST